MKTCKFVLQNGNVRARCVEAIIKLPADEVYEVQIKPYRKTRTNQQNARYWALVTKVAQYSGESKDAMHEVFKRMFLPPQIVVVNGHTFHVYSSAKEGTKEFAEYSEQVEAFCATDLGIALPAWGY